MKTVFSIFVIMAAMLTNIAFAQSECDTETKKAKAIFDRCGNSYNKCLEKYKVPSEQVKNGQAQCLQEYQNQQTKYTKCIEASGYNKCMQEYQTRIASEQTKCIEEYKSQMAQRIQTAMSDYTKCLGAAASDYTKCLEASGYTKCQQEYQTITTTSDYTKCLEKYKDILEQVTSGKAQCQQEYQAKIYTEAYKKCLQEYQTQQAKADKICPRTVYISELEERGGVYFMKNKPYNGKVNCSDGVGYICEVNMKNGKFHGKYFYASGGDGETFGNYKDGKPHGEWKRYDYDIEGERELFPTVKYYIDGVEQKQ